MTQWKGDCDYFQCFQSWTSVGVEKSDPMKRGLRPTNNLPLTNPYWGWKEWPNEKGIATFSSPPFYNYYLSLKRVTQWKGDCDSFHRYCSGNVRKVEKSDPMKRGLRPSSPTTNIISNQMLKRVTQWKGDCDCVCQTNLNWLLKEVEKSDPMKRGLRLSISCISSPPLWKLKRVTQWKGDVWNRESRIANCGSED